MGDRLDTDRQASLEPRRMTTAKERLLEKGCTLTYQDKTQIEFLYKGHTVKYWPYSGWHSGKTIKDGCGLENLLRQLI